MIKNSDRHVYLFNHHKKPARNARTAQEVRVADRSLDSATVADLLIFT